MSYDENDTQYQIDVSANLLAASVSELAGCSSDATHVVEMALSRALKDANPYQVKAVYNAVHAAFSEGIPE